MPSWLGASRTTTIERRQQAGITPLTPKPNPITTENCAQQPIDLTIAMLTALPLIHLCKL